MVAVEDKVKISVVVPVYNAGTYLDACVASVLGQSLPPEEYEAVFVDDGSTDGTGERLVAAVAGHDHVRVVRTENSGGPGRPRNLGLDMARGEYVYFLDCDDWLGPEALERMYAMAARNRSDVLVGRLVGHGRGVPRRLFRRDRDRAEILAHHLLTLLTPHKLFRTAFLREHGLRFPEGPVRLEDHRFCVPAYLKAEVISVLASYPCCHWVKRADEGNYSSRRFDPEHYFGALREVLDMVDEHVPPGETRDRFYAHWLRGKMLQRVGGRRLLNYPPEYRRELYAAVRRLAVERFAPGTDRFLPAGYRPRAVILRAGSYAELEALAEAEKRIVVRARAVEMRLENGALTLVLSAELVYRDGGPVPFRRVDRNGGRRVLWNPPVVLGTPIPEEARDMTDALPRAGVEVFARHRSTRDEAAFAVIARRREEEGPDEHLLFDVRARLEGLADLAPGAWDLRVRINACGWNPHRRVPGVWLLVSLDGAAELRVDRAFPGAPEGFRRLRRVGRRVPGLRRAVRVVRTLS